MSKRKPSHQAAQRPNGPARHDQHVNALAQALAAHQQGQLADAARGYQSILSIVPQHFDALHYLGVVKMQTGDNDEGIYLIEQALRVRPDAADALSNLANGLMRARRYADALQYLDRAVKISPRQPEAHTNRGLALAALRRPEEAAAAHERALALRPDFAEAHNNLGNALRALGRFEEAITAYDKALQLRPANPEALNNRGLALHALRCFAQALASYDNALSLRANYAEAHNNRGNTLKERQDFDGAFSSYEEALRLKPDYAEAHYNRGNTFGALNRHEEALHAYAAALAIEPEHVDANWNKGLSHLLLGQMQQGWTQYEWRWRVKGAELPRQFACPAWNGDESLAGKRIVLWAEQGLGDTLQFCRYANVLATQGAEVVLEVQPPLVGLLRSIKGAKLVRTAADTLADADFHCPLLSLPGRLGDKAIPAAVPYLEVSAVALEKWKTRIDALAPGSRRRIGIACSGNSKLANDRNRSIALELFAPLFALDADFFLVQKECRPGDEAFLQSRPEIRDLRAELNDFVDTAAVLSELDLLISVDTSVAHLAGALARPVWVLLPFAPDWRWQLSREDSPWYPTARLWRQSAIGDWAGVIARLTEALRKA